MDKYTRIVGILTKNPELTISEIHKKTFLGPVEIFDILEGNKHGVKFKRLNTERGFVYSII